jgi:hypothetical protein
MNALWKANASAAPWAPPSRLSVGFPRAGDLATGEHPTHPGRQWFQALTDELRGVIEGAGLTFDQSDPGQLLHAIEILAGVVRMEIGILSLDFSKQNQSPYVVPLPAALTDMSEQFVSDSGQFTLYTEGSIGSFNVTGGAGVITNTGTQNTIVQQNATSLPIPQCWVQATVDVSSSATGYDNGGVGLVKDQNNFLFASVDRLAGVIRIQIKIAGASTFVDSISQVIPNSFKIALSLIGNSACAYLDTGSGFQFLSSAQVAAYYDFTTVGSLSGWKPGYTLANGGGNSAWRYTNFLEGRFGGVGIRDCRLVTNEDLTPHMPTSTSVLFTASLSDPTGASSTGVLSLDLSTYAVTQVSTIMVTRGGHIVPDVSAHIVYYPNGDRRMLMSTWANGFGGEIQVQYAFIASGGGDILDGSWAVPMTTIALPGQTGARPGAYDAMMTYDSTNGRWIIGYVLTTDTTFAGSPFFAAACTTTDFETFSLIGSDVRREGYEGACLARVAGAIYLLVGGPAGAATSSAVYEAETMAYQGSLNLEFNGGSVTQPWPMLFPFGDEQVVITFDDTKYSSRDFTWGDLQVWTAPRYR